MKAKIPNKQKFSPLKQNIFDVRKLLVKKTVELFHTSFCL